MSLKPISALLPPQESPRHASGEPSESVAQSSDSLCSFFLESFRASLLFANLDSFRSPFFLSRLSSLLPPQLRSLFREFGQALRPFQTPVDRWEAVGDSGASARSASEVPASPFASRPLRRTSQFFQTRRADSVCSGRTLSLQFCQLVCRDSIRHRIPGIDVCLLE